MATTNVGAQVLDTLMSSPGMSDVVKIDLKISRKNILLLNSVIDRGISNNEGDDGILASVPATVLQELAGVANDLLEKAGLVEFNQKFKQLTSKA